MSAGPSPGDERGPGVRELLLGNEQREKQCNADTYKLHTTDLSVENKEIGEEVVTNPGKHDHAN